MKLYIKILIMSVKKGDNFFKNPFKIIPQTPKA